MTTPIPGADLVAAVEAVRRGATPQPRGIETAEALLGAMQRAAVPLDVEHVVKWSEALVLSPKTIRNYVSILLGKLDAHSRGEGIVRAREAGFGQGGQAG